MKKIFTLTIVLLSCMMIHAQIPNPSFENWTSGDADGWYTTSGILTNTLSQSSNAHQGTKAISIDVANLLGTNVAGTLDTKGSGGSIGYYHETTQPAALHGWYILNSSGGDYGFGLMTVYGGGTFTGAGTGDSTNFVATAVYKEFIINMAYFSLNTSDSAEIEFSIGSHDSSHVGTHFIIDDLSYGAAAGIDEIKNRGTVLEEASPNPANNTTNLIYSISSNSNVKLSVFDLMGREVKVLVNEQQHPGRYKAILDVNEFPSGTYFYQLNVNGGLSSKKLVIVK
jgi:hypothetical protein